MGKSNASLHQSRRNKNDEFYTRYADIELEVNHYWSQLKDKTVYCNADNPFKSQFVRYFIRNFNQIGLRGLIATSREDGCGYLCIVPSVPNFDDEDRFIEEHTMYLDGDGSFESDECKEWLETCDVVITNPPFSVFLPWYKLIKEYNKKMLVVMNANGFLYNDCVGDVVDGVLKGGYTAKNGFTFDTPEGQPPKKIGYTCWMTTLDVEPNPPLTLTRKIDDTYKYYDGQPDTIEVSKTKDIPMDYYGRMGVPITYILHHCPTQFKILGKADHSTAVTSNLFCP